MIRYGQPLGAAGVRYKLPRYAQGAAQQAPSLATKRVTPHIFRHTTAVHLVAAGVDVTVIRSWLGHAHLDTTNRYAQATLETKRAALEQLAPNARSAPPPPWKQDDALLTWLESLWEGKHYAKDDRTSRPRAQGEVLVLRIIWSLR